MRKKQLRRIRAGKGVGTNREEDIKGTVLNVYS